MEFLTYTLDNYANSIVCLCLVTVIWLYFRNNPLQHSSWFILRRFINWFPLGMTYSFLYMGRYLKPRSDTMPKPKAKIRLDRAVNFAILTQMLKNNSQAVILVVAVVSDAVGAC